MKCEIGGAGLTGQAGTSVLGEIKSIIKEIAKSDPTVRDYALRLYRWAKRVISLVRRNGVIAAYMRDHSLRKVNIGCGSYGHSGWLNCDYDPLGPGTIFLDAAKPFPFVDRSIDYLYSEHMIEHLVLADGRAFLKECARVLRPGGRLRLATPDLDRFLGLFGQGDELGAKYSDWVSGEYFADLKTHTHAMVLNNMMSNFGHRFVYDEKTLRLVLEEAGFDQVVRCGVGQSGDAHLQGLERHGLSIGDDLNEFETMVVEAIRRGA